MVDFNETQTLAYKYFRGINARDDENNLPIGQTPDAQNFEVVKQTGLKKREGFDPIFSLNNGFSLSGAANYTTKDNESSYMAVSYPSMYLFNKFNGFPLKIAGDLVSTGKPKFFDLSAGQTMMVDGANAPRLITDKVVSTVPWPPTYNNQNNTRLNESNNATQANPTTLGTDIWYPSFGVFHLNRAWLSGDPKAPFRIYVSKIFDYDDFGTNSSTTEFNIAFFVDVDTRSPITSLKVINNEFLVIYCERELHVLTGKFPPGTNYPGTKFDISPLNRRVGCLSDDLVESAGNNDHYFMANNGGLYRLSSTDNFEDVKPLGLSEKVFPLLENTTNETFKRGRLINHDIKGELQLWFPSENSLRYPDQRLIYNYSEALNPSDEEWSRDREFGDFYLRDGFVDRETSDLILVTPNKILNGNKGTTYDGKNIDMYYQLSTLDFDDPDRKIEIIKAIMYVTNFSETPTDISFYHLWEDQEAGLTTVPVGVNSISKYGTSNFGSAIFSSFAGNAFQKIEFAIPNRIGKILKIRVRHNAVEDIFIHSINLRFKPLGK